MWNGYNTKIREKSNAKVSEDLECQYDDTDVDECCLYRMKWKCTSSI